MFRELGLREQERRFGISEDRHDDRTGFRFPFGLPIKKLNEEPHADHALVGILFDESFLSEPFDEMGHPSDALGEGRGRIRSFENRAQVATRIAQFQNARQTESVPKLRS